MNKSEPVATGSGIETDLKSEQHQTKDTKQEKDNCTPSSQLQNSNKETSLEDRILLLFQNEKSETSLTALAIAKALELENRKAVNPSLYKLAAKGILRYQTPGPIWSLISKDVSTNSQSSKTKSKENSPETNTAILSFLKDEKVLKEHPQGVPTLTIAKHVFGSSSSCKTINPILYRLQGEGKITKISETDGTKPRWLIRN